MLHFAEYVLDIACSQDGSAVAGALSNRSIVLLDSSLGVSSAALKGHEGMITELAFGGTATNPNILFSSSEDTTVRGWDFRSGKEVMRLSHEAEALSLSLGCGGTMLATGSAEAAHFFDLRTGTKIGTYADNHTDLVTRVRFNPFNETELATGAEDGLVCLYDTTQANAEASLQCVINPACPVRRIGFFAPGGQGIFVQTVHPPPKEKYIY